jgi:RNA polymerase sigma-70 factor (ECF subfamily)
MPAPPKSKSEGDLAANLVEAAKAGSAAAFEELVRRYRPRIYALALHLTGRPSDADDVTQEAFLRAYRNLEKFEGRSEFFTWLYRIALHRALNMKRDRGRRTLVDLEDPRVRAAVDVDAHGDPRRALELQESYAQLLACFDRLSPSLRTTVVLTQLQGLSHKEAAVVLETTEGTIAWRVHEARRQLRASLERIEDQRTPTHALERAREVGRYRFHGDMLEAAIAQLLPMR